jgi:hypothetical protein
VDALLTSNETKTISGLYRLLKSQPDPNVNFRTNVYHQFSANVYQGFSPKVYHFERVGETPFLGEM